MIVSTFTIKSLSALVFLVNCRHIKHKCYQTFSDFAGFAGLLAFSMLPYSFDVPVLAATA